MLIRSIVFKLGALEVFQKYQLSDFAVRRDLPGFYWSDPANIGGIGPFASIYDTVNHYAIHIKTIKRPPPLTLVPASDTVIPVDFTSKKRI